MSSIPAAILLGFPAKGNPSRRGMRLGVQEEASPLWKCATMNDREYVARLRAAILGELGITQPPFQLKVETDVGGAAVTLRDARAGVDDFGAGRFVGSVLLSDLADNRILESAQEAAEALRPGLDPQGQ